MGIARQIVPHVTQGARLSTSNRRVNGILIIIQNPRARVHCARQIFLQIVRGFVYPCNNSNALTSEDGRVRNYDTARIVCFKPTHSFGTGNIQDAVPRFIVLNSLYENRTVILVCMRLALIGFTGVFIQRVPALPSIFNILLKRRCKRIVELFKLRDGPNKRTSLFHEVGIHLFIRGFLIFHCRGVFLFDFVTHSEFLSAVFYSDKIFSVV